MTDRVAELAAAGRALSPEDRVRLLDLLLESLHEATGTELDDSWKQEVERRIASHERGEGELLDVDDVMAEAARVAP
jgi:putative addiction module component (TIGR02574 family)